MKIKEIISIKKKKKEKKKKNKKFNYINKILIKKKKKNGTKGQYSNAEVNPPFMGIMSFCPVYVYIAYGSSVCTGAFPEKNFAFFERIQGKQFLYIAPEG